MEKSLETEGTVVSGMGKGKEFMSIPQYQKQMADAFSFIPYLGTLNVMVSPEDISKIRHIGESNGTLIHGFEANGRTFGDVYAYRAEINGTKCILLMPKLSKHTDQIELIWSESLREKLKLIDGSKVKVRVFLE